MKSAIGAVVAALCVPASRAFTRCAGRNGHVFRKLGGAAYTNDQNGAFTHWAAGTQYESGIYFVVTINDKPQWTLAFCHEKWKFTTDRAFPIELTFDGQTPFNVHGVPSADKLLQVPMPSTPLLIAQFRENQGDDRLHEGTFQSSSIRRRCNRCRRWQIASPR